MLPMKNDEEPENIHHEKAIQFNICLIPVMLY